MYDVLNGIRVVEVAEWLFVPCAGVVMADWGADVIKVEHPVTGDPLRATHHAVQAPNSPYNTLFELSNRGKRSIGIDLANPDGRGTLDDLLRHADVLMTSFTEATREKLHLDSTEVLERHPHLVFGRGTAYGPRGPLAGDGGYDMTSFWARAGMAERITPPGGEPPMMPGNIGDLSAAVALAGAVSAALLRRERTGKGTVVDVSLFGMGTYLMTQSLTAAQFGLARRYRTSRDPHNPLTNMYRTKDDRWIMLALLQSDKWWTELCELVGHPELRDDPRFVDHAARDAHKPECVDVFTAVFLSRTYAEWVGILSAFSGPWAPFQSVPEVLEDPQTLDNAYVAPVVVDGTRSYLGVPSPGQFDGAAVGRLDRAPEHGQQTEEILLELGLDWDAIADLKRCGAVL